MNVQTAPRTHTPAVVPFVSAAARTAPRERDFGVGYGKSSGYAATRRYTQPSVAPRLFRFA